MMKKIPCNFSGAIFIAALFFCFFICACEKYSEGQEPVKIQEKSDAEKKLSEIADKYFAGNQVAKNEWIKMQLQASDSINSYIPEIPLNVFAQIKKFCEQKHQDSFTDRYAEMLHQIDGYKALKNSNATKPDAHEFAVKSLAKVYPEDYYKQFRALGEWTSFYKSMYAQPLHISKKTSDFISSKAAGIAVEKGLTAGRAYLESQRGAAVALAARKLKNATDANAAKLKDCIAEETPDDFVSQLAKFDKIAKDFTKNPELEVYGIKLSSKQTAKTAETSAANLDSKDKTADIFRGAVFTRHTSVGTSGGVSSAVLTKQNGKVFLLCTKDFMPEKFPAVFSNSLGKIKCSRAFISKTLPVLMMIPDEDVPPVFSPIEIVSPEESAALFDKTLHMIAPSNNGVKTRQVSVFSEDERYLNLTLDSGPSIRRSIKIGALDRDANKIMVAVQDSIEIGEHAIVIDSESGKLASIAIRTYAPGIIELAGKTGSVLGHEKYDLPDFNTIVRNFDGTVSRTTYTPRSQINFIRMTALEDWEKLTPEAFYDQKTNLRKFTDSNNDFLMFFKYNSFDEALRLDRLRDVAERHRRQLVEENLDRRTFETAYKKYMIEVLYVLRREMTQFPNADNFYSIYRREMDYQVNLRKAMYEYLSESVKENNLSNIIHADLKTRYYDAGRTVRRSTDSSGNSSVTSQNGNRVNAF